MTGGDLPSPREPLAGAASLLPRLVRAWWIGAIAFGVGLVGSAIWVVSTKRMYRSEAVVVYERPLLSVLGSAAEGGGSPRQVGVQLRDMTASRQRLEKLIKDMKLYAGVVSKRGMVDAVEEMRKGISVAVREGYTFRVSYDSTSRDLAQQVLTALLQSIVDEDTQKREQESEQAKTFLDREKKHADEVLKEKEGALAAFLTRHPELAAEAVTTGGTVRVANQGHDQPDSIAGVAPLEVQAADLERQLAEATGGAEAAPGQLPPDPALTAMRASAMAEVQAAERSMQDKQARFTDEHPDVKLARWQLSQAQAKLRAADAALAAPRPIAAATPRTASNPGGGAARAAALRRALAAIRSEIGAIRSRSARRPEVRRGSAAAGTQATVAVDTEWTQLARAVNEARERQQQLEPRRFHADLQATLVADKQAGGLMVTDPPFRPMRPASGERTKVAVVGMVGSLLLSVLAAFVAAMFDRRLYDRRDISRVVGPDVIVVVAKLAMARKSA